MYIICKHLHIYIQGILNMNDEQVLNRQINSVTNYLKMSMFVKLIEKEV